MFFAVDADGKPKVTLPPPTVITTLPPIGAAAHPPPPPAPAPVASTSPPQLKKPSFEDLLEDAKELPLAPVGDSEDPEGDVAIKGGGARLAMMRRLMRTKTREQCVMILR